MEKEKLKELKQETDGIGKVTLQDVYDTYNKWLHIEDTRRIDTGLAVALTQKMKGTPVWLFFVGDSGDWKSEQLKAFEGFNTIIMNNFTSKTLISGSKNVLQGEDLAPELNNKLLIIPDMAQLLKLDPREKGEVWAQLRDLFDGEVKKRFGNGVNKMYNNLRVTFMAGSTPAIDSQILIHQDLGTRELIYRTHPVKNYKKLQIKLALNEKSEKQMRKELNEITVNFLRNCELKDIEISEDIKNILFNMAIFLTYARASADIDSFSGELKGDVSRESPTRVYKQFLRIYKSLKNLSDDYPDDKAVAIIAHIVDSSAFQIRMKILNFLLKHKNEQFSTSHVANVIRIGKKTSYKELGVLYNLKLIKHALEPQEWGKEYDKWWWDGEENGKNYKKFVLIPVTKYRIERLREINNIIIYKSICIQYIISDAPIIDSDNIQSPAGAEDSSHHIKESRQQVQAASLLETKTKTPIELEKKPKNMPEEGIKTEVQAKASPLQAGVLSQSEVRAAKEQGLDLEYYEKRGVKISLKKRFWAQAKFNISINTLDPSGEPLIASEGDIITLSYDEKPLFEAFINNLLRMGAIKIIKSNIM